jgi:hypothetical protein
LPFYFREIARLRQENEQLKSQLGEEKMKAEVLERLSGSDLKQRLELSLKALPPEVDFPVVLSVIEQIATSSSLTVEGVSFGKESLLSLVLSGSQDGLKAFFTNLDKALPLLSVEEVNLKAFPGKLQAEITLKPYSLPIDQKINLPQKISFILPEEEKTLEKLSQFFSSPPSALEAPSAQGRINPFF